MQGKVQPRAFNDDSLLLTSEPANFYRLPLPLDRIFLIDNARSLRECMQVLCAVSLFPACTEGPFKRFQFLPYIRSTKVEVKGGGGEGGRGKDIIAEGYKRLAPVTLVLVIPTLCTFLFNNYSTRARWICHDR